MASAADVKSIMSELLEGLKGDLKNEMKSQINTLRQALESQIERLENENKLLRAQLVPAQSSPIDQCDGRGVVSALRQESQESGCSDGMRRLSLNSAPPPAPVTPDLNQLMKDIEVKHLKKSKSFNYKAVVQKVIVEKLIQPYLTQVGREVIYMGSSYEHTGIPNVSDFDLQLLISFPTFKDLRYEDSDVEGWKKIKGGRAELLDDEGFLSASKMRRYVQSEMQKAFTSASGEKILDDYKVRLSTQGPAITLTVESVQQSVKFDVDVVICMHAKGLTNGKNFDLVAKAFDKTQPGKNSNLWRMSYSRSEQELLRSIKHTAECKLTVYQIVKMVKKKNKPQLGKFSSYFFKNILFQVHSDPATGNPDMWTRELMGDRFKDMLDVTQRALEEGKLPIHFNPMVNLLQDNNSKAIDNVVNYLKERKRRGDYYKLLQPLLTE